MRCPNCEELLKDDAKVCFSCGQDLKDHAIDSLIQEMIDEDSGSVANKNNTKHMNHEKISNKSKSNTRVSKDMKSKEADNSQEIVKGKIVYGQAFRITAYVTCIFLLVVLFSLVMNWFSLSGRGSYLGFVDDQSKNYKTDEVRPLNAESITNLDETVVILEFSPKSLYQYSKINKEDYSTLVDKNGLSKRSWPITIQQLYIKGLLIIPIMIIVALMLLIIDRRLYMIEVVRGFSLITFLIILLNYLALKVTFFSMFAIRAKSILQISNNLNRVTMNLNGINLNNDFYPYKLVEQPGFYIALVACSVWFILTTVLIEMKKDKNKQYG